MAERLSAAPHKKGREIPSNPEVVICAGTSPRRKSFLEYCLPESTIFSFSAGAEPDVEDEMIIARNKLEVVRKIVGTDRSVLIGADTRNAILELAREGHGRLAPKCKPKWSGEVKDVFGAMIQASEKTGQNPYYQVRSSSCFHGTMFGGYRGIERIKTISTIELDKKKIKYLSTRKGFREYLDTFEQFYSSEVYSNNGHHPPIKVTDISAGLSMGVLRKIDAIVAVDDVYTGDRNFDEKFKIALYNATVGISPLGLRSLKPNAEDLILNWPWLNQLASHSIPSQTEAGTAEKTVFAAR